MRKHFWEILLSLYQLHGCIVHCFLLCEVIRDFSERFEPRSHFKSRLSLIVLVNVVLKRTVVVKSGHRQSQSELNHLVDGIILWLLT